MEFEAKLSSSIAFKKVVEALKDLITDGSWDVTQDGISLQAMDSSHVALVSLLLRADGFETFELTEDISLGINLTSVSKIMKCGANDDTLTFRRSKDDPDVITFLFENESKSKTSDFQLKLMDIDGEGLGIPEQQHDVVIEMSSDEYAKICKDLTIMGDSVTIDATTEGVRFSVRGDIGSGNVLIRNDGAEALQNSGDGVLTQVTVANPVSQTFALRYLNFFTKATALSDKVIMSMSADVPCVLEYPINGLGYIRFYLAPKIEN